MKTLIAAIIAGILSLLSFFSQAQNNISIENQCEVNMQGDISMRKGDIRIFSEDKKELLITEQKELFFEGNKINLNAQQQAWVDEYYAAIENTIPQVVKVTREAIKIANYAVTEVLEGFLGSNSKAVETLRNKLDQIDNGLESHLNQDPEYITFDTQTLEHDIGVSREWENQYEDLLEEVIPTAMGEIIMALGRAMINGESEINSFEQRMERMGEEIEQKVTARADEIEKDAATLCQYMKQVDIAESKVQKIPQLKNIDMMKFNQRA
ncbi:DUF2884 family protein [Glaciecola sp. KUL10]|uniref:DUF2884 family protein n=1 Tax=Glaciecola sp. (strain KUL10) TaxID=2161813 RepID=UPI000D784BCF|nr:DUF2884 family protein [Glaciecola sp. KUL10]GBL06015.1 hypothetical protein KUL10_33490 [Glaciecola sp. KUL10]